MDRNHRNKNARKSLLLTDVPESIRVKLVADAKEQDTSINEAAVRILCAAMKVKHIPSANGYVAYDRGGRGALLLRGGAALHRALDRSARKRGGTLRGICLDSLSRHYDLGPYPITRQPRKERTTV